MTAAAPLLAPTRNSDQGALRPALASIASSARIQRLAPWLAGILTLVAAVLAIDPLPVGVFYDDAQYLILAKALANGDGYRFLNLPGSPLATHFPPGYPALLALLWRVAPSFPENVAIFKFANAVLLAFAAVCCFRFAGSTAGLPSPLALVATLAGTVTIPSLVLSSSIMSEPFFLALLFPLLGWAERATTVASPERQSSAELRTAILLGMCAGCLALVRTHGVVLVPAIAVAYVRRRRWRAALLSAGAALTAFAPWLLWVRLHDAALPALVRGAYGSYDGWLLAGLRAEGLRLLGVTVLDNVATIWWTLVRCLVPAGHSTFEIVAGIAFFMLSVASLGTLWRRARVTLVFVALYFAIVIGWPFSPLRFVWAVWPLLMLLPAVGAHALWSAHGSVRRRAARRLAAVGASVVIIVGSLWFNTRGYANAWWAANARFHARRVLPQLAWVERTTRPTDIIASDAEGAVYLYTGRRAVPITSFTASEYVRERSAAEQIATVRAMLNQFHPRFVVATSLPLIQAASRIADSVPSLLVRVDSISRGEVFAHQSAAQLPK